MAHLCLLLGPGGWGIAAATTTVALAVPRIFGRLMDDCAFARERWRAFRAGQ